MWNLIWDAVPQYLVQYLKFHPCTVEQEVCADGLEEDLVSKKHDCKTTLAIWLTVAQKDRFNLIESF